MERPANEAIQTLHGKVVAITGGARGIGEATARKLAAAGSRVSIGDLDVEAAKATAESLGTAHLGLGVDVTDPASFENYLSRTESELGPVDVLINNAGVMFIARLDEQSEEAIDTTLAVNLHGVITGTRLALKRMRPRGRGLIVNIASQAGKAGLVGGSIYSATKFGVVGFTEAMRRELHGTGVGVSCVMPAPVDTRMGHGLPSAAGLQMLSTDEVSDAIIGGIVRRTPEVWVPRRSRPMMVLAGLLPIPAQDWLTRLMKVDRVLVGAEPSSRKEYESRITDESDGGRGS